MRGERSGTSRPTGRAFLLAMALGGWLQSRRVAETMSRDVTDLNRGQGLTTWGASLPLVVLLGILAFSALT